MHTPISRRFLLKSSGIAVALPLLETMSPALASATQTPPKRMVLICNTLGLHPPSLFPKTDAPEDAKTEYLSLLSEHRDDFTLISGLSHPDQNGKQPHDTEMTWLSSARNPGLGGFKNSISVDQVAAEELGHATRFPSLSLSTNTVKSQSYTRNGVMIPAHDKPSEIFSQLFLSGSRSQVGLQRYRLANGRSILDSVAEQTRELKRKTSDRDHRQLDEYFEAIRSAEADLKTRQEWLDKPKPKVDAEPPADVADRRDLIGRTSTLMNLIPLILQTDSTRVIAMVIQDHGVVPTIEGVTSEHHNLSHHGQDPDKIKQLKLIESQLLGCYGDLLASMKKSEGDSRLLDHTSVLFGSNLGNANAHDPTNLPILVSGGGFGHGKVVRSGSRTDNTPLCNLFVNLLNNVGVETDKFGSSSGTFTF